MPVSGLTPFLPFIAEYGYTGTLLSFLVTIRCLASFVSLLFVNIFYKKLSLRLGLSLSCLTIAFALIVMSFAKNYYFYAAGAALLGIGYGLGTIIPVSVLIHNWFARRRATVLSICIAGSSICNTFFPPLITKLAIGYSLPHAFRCMSLIPIAVASIVFLFVRDTPSQKGLLPAGAEDSPEAEKKSATASLTTLSGTPFVLVCFSTALFGGFVMASYNHFSVLFTTIGFSKEMAAVALSMEGVALTVSKLAFGFITDRFGGKRTSLSFLLILLIGTVLITLSSNGAFFMFAGMLLIGIGFPCSAIGAAIWAGDLSTPQAYPSRLKTLQSCHTFGSILLSSLPGWFFDLSGSYVPGYAVLCCLLAVFLCLLLNAYRVHAREERQAVLSSAASKD